jgi:hypothetical protein
LLKPVGTFGYNVTINGITKSLAQLARDLGIRADTLKWRLKNNYPIDKEVRNWDKIRKNRQLSTDKINTQL